MTNTILHAPELPPGEPVLLFGRVSGQSQWRRGSLATQMWCLWLGARQCGLKPGLALGGVERGRLNDPRPIFFEAIDTARRVGVGILVYDLNRLIRAANFDAQGRARAQPTAAEIDDLLWLAEGVPFLATLVDPTLPPARLHGAAVRRGMRQRGNGGGRPKAASPATRDRILAESAAGASGRELARRFGLPESTVRSYIRSARLAQAPASGADRMLWG